MDPIPKIFSKANDFSLDIRAIVAVAAAESASFGHNYIGTEHVLCALIQTSDTKLIGIFVLFGLHIESVRDSVLKIATGGSNHASDKLRPQTPRLRKVLGLARDKLRRSREFTLAQSVLLGILQEGNGVAIRALRSLGVDLARLGQEVEATHQSSNK